ncbi:fimbrial protein [Buttiauxella selenatireducens]|uniref:Fimbrial protein n=1 Tax=Buttiauxella selenatireducens TaxID=3073902 RepID=A0ABY9SEN5_9ENTR|nr:fimbrial protein [Buttiauxella sp. R73]WMY75330.1 fimbrial protein [Buttiauxella sp. R73]
MKRILNILLMLLTVTSFYSEASCVVNQTVRKTIQFSSIVVQRDTAIGSTIATVTSYPSNIQTGGCSNGGYEYEKMMYLGGVSSVIPKVYNTNILGVGIQGNFDGATWTFLNPPNPVYIGSTTGTYDGGTGQNFQLIKTGNIVSGSLSSGLAAIVYYDGNSTNAVEISLATSTVTQVACAITTPNLTFWIGNILTSTFGTSVGTTPAGASNTQNLGLNCDPQANINVSLSGTQNPDVPTTSVLALTGQGGANVAKGVGVQILYNNSPLALNSRIVLKTSSGGQETFPLTARYYQTKTTVTTGTANASATLNITYQ